MVIYKFPSTKLLWHNNCQCLIESWKWYKLLFSFYFDWKLKHSLLYFHTLHYTKMRKKEKKRKRETPYLWENCIQSNIKIERRKDKGTKSRPSIHSNLIFLSFFFFLLVKGASLGQPLKQLVKMYPLRIWRIFDATNGSRTIGYPAVLLELSCTFFVASSFQETSTRGSWYSSGLRAKAKSGNVGAVSIILQPKWSVV